MSVNIQLKEVRLSFPALFEPKASVEGGKLKYKATFLFPPTHPAKAQLEQAIQEAAVQLWKDRADGKLAYLRNPSTQGRIYCFGDGNLLLTQEGKQVEHFPGNWYAQGSNDHQPTLLTRQREPVTQTNQHILYAGCWVNAVLNVKAMDWNDILCIYAEVQGVQFVRDDTPFSAPKVADPTVFDDLGPPPANDAASTQEGAEDYVAF